MWHKPCRTFHPWCPCIKTRCLFTSFERVVSCVICGLQGLSYSHVPDCIYMSFLLFCLSITIFIFILNYVLIVTFWIFTYYKIWILLNMYCFILNYLLCSMFGSVLECYGLNGVSLVWTRRALANTHPSRQPGTSARKTWYPDSANSQNLQTMDFTSHPQPAYYYITASASF